MFQWPKEKGQTMIYKTLHRRTDNTMAKRKRTMIYKTLHRTDNTMAKRKVLFLLTIELSVLLCNVL
jgi:hypothetical protein